MPGLGGIQYSKQNAIDTADALNKIVPDFISIRTLALKDNLELFEDYENKVFTRTSDIQVVEELLEFTQQLENMDSYVRSDHILNLLPEFEGHLKTDKQKLIDVLTSFLNLNKDEQMIYQVGRRIGYMSSTNDLKILRRRKAVEDVIIQENINLKNIDLFIEDRLNQFI